MIRHKGSIEIGAPVSDVFTFISNVENIPKWQSDVVTSKVHTSGPMRVGTMFEEDVKILGKQVQTVCEVVEYLPTKKFGFRSNSATPLQYGGFFSLEPNGRGTRLTIDVEIWLRGFWKLVEPLFGFEVRNGIQKELKTLKSILEKV
ncbi:MAG: SRPBCC family protein [Ignavibacteriales bacterium]|nr:SRPBCC family protein [Ignavibacteriales bacterium]